MSEVFISYARSTAAQADGVAQALRSLGYSVWIDEDLPAHRAYAEVITEHLEAAAAVVVVWSAEAARSQWVQSEADRARAQAKLVQLTVDGAMLPMPFDRIQCADLAGWTGDVEAPGWRKVVASVRDLVGAPDSRGVRTARVVAGSQAPLLAVLAFDNLSGDPEMAYFSDGVSEEILQTVARGAELKVIGRSSSFQFRGPQKAAAHVATSLKATHVLDGSVRRSGPRVRISANLIECVGETTLWSDRFDRELSDVFALQDEIAATVAAALKVAFAPAVKAETVDPAAFSLYLKALESRNRGLEPAILLAVIETLEEATTLAPTFARAWAFLATMRAECLRFDESEQPHAVTRAEVVTAAQTALALDPALGSAHQALGQLEAFGRFAEREAFHLKALSASPNDPTVLTNASLFFAEVGRIKEALGYARQAYSLDPMYPWVANWYAATLSFDHQWDESRALRKRLCALWPGNELIAWDAIFSASTLGDWPWFNELVKTAHERGLDSPTLRGVIEGGEELRDCGPEVQARALKRAKDGLTRAGVLSIATYASLCRLGLNEEVFGLIDQASFDFMFDPERRSPNGVFGANLIFSRRVNLMSDIRFVGLCAKLGLVDYWVKSDRWPDCAETVAACYDFKAEARRLAAAQASVPGVAAAGPVD